MLKRLVANRRQGVSYLVGLIGNVVGTHDAWCVSLRASRNDREGVASCDAWCGRPRHVCFAVAKVRRAAHHVPSGEEHAAHVAALISACDGAPSRRPACIRLVRIR
ncbi:hypothetical protein BCEN4_190006 [Burkholderia cenocepacia]|nr:hypothetical protein BCEN4_190006 [Burkholderia cenocepacia]